MGPVIMKNSVVLRPGISALLISVLLSIGADLKADALTPPILIGTSVSASATLSIPRWKGYMLESDPNQFWISYANSNSTQGNISYTTDAGETWSTNVIQIDFTGWLDQHLSAHGRNGNLYFTWPSGSGINFRRFSPPAHSTSDRGAIAVMPGTTSSHRSNIMIQNTGRIWLFTRLSYASVAENVLYNYSDDGGSTWHHGTAYATDYNSVRIGSMPYVGGNPALVVLYLDSNRGYEYYLWNGTTFEARPDHSIYPVNMGQVRSFTHNQIRDSVFHLIFGLGTSLHHVWKNYNSGTGTWNHQIIDNSSTTLDMEWYPTSTVRGDDLYLFYCKMGAAGESSRMIYYKRWSQLTRSWTEPILVSTDPANVANRIPNTCFHVPENSAYIPVVWQSGTGPVDLWFSKVMVSRDSIPPATVHDLGLVPGSLPSKVVLSWTAPGGDSTSGQAAVYDIRFAEFSLTTGQWPTASPVANPPSPKPTGEIDSCVVTGLSPGTSYYFALKTEDASSNWSDMSNVVTYTTPTDIPDVQDGSGLPRETAISSNTPNPFSVATNIQFSLQTRSRVSITVYDLLGRKVADVLDKTLPAGVFAAHWDGRDDNRNQVATGVYFSRLIADNRTSSHAMVLIR